MSRRPRTRAALLDRQGWQVNRKRVRSLWREEAVKVPLAATPRGPLDPTPPR